MKYLDGLAVAKLRNLRLELPHHRSEGHLAGRHKSVHHGFSQEFAHHREYCPGDEIRYLDWKVYARKERYFVKQFQEEKSLNAYLVLDSSGSMGYGGEGRETKWDYACRLCAALAYLILMQGDAAGFVRFDTAPRVFVSPSHSLTHLEMIGSRLEEARPGGETDLAGVLRSAMGLVSRRSLVILISDLLGEAASILEVVVALRARKHEAFVIQVLDPSERDLDLEGPVEFESLENGERLRCEASAVRPAYRSYFDRQLRLYEAGFRSSAITYATAFTDIPWERFLSGFLASGAGPRGRPSRVKATP